MSPLEKLIMKSTTNLLLDHIRNDNVDAVAEMLAHGVDVNARDVYKLDPIHSAVREKNEEILKLVLDAGAEVNSRDHCDRTALHYVAMNAKCTVGVNLANELLSRGTNVNLKDEYGETALNLAAKMGNKGVIDILLEAGADVDLKNNEGHNVLHCLVMNTRFSSDDAQVTNILKISQINSQDKYGDTPLHLAAKWSNFPIFRLLLRAGADANLKNADHYTPLHTIILHTKSSVATKLATELLLTKYNADINATDGEGNTALHLAASTNSNRIQLVRLFLTNRADVSKKNHNGYTPLEEQIISGNVEMIKSLAHYDENVRENFVKIACIQKNRYVIKCLLKNGIDLNSKDNNGYTIFLHQMSIHNLTPDLIKLFLKHGGDVNMLTPDRRNILTFTHKETYWQSIVEHTAKLQALGLAVNPNLMDTIRRDASFRPHFENFLIHCEVELFETKNYKFGDSSITLYDVLVGDKCRLERYARNKNFISYLAWKQIKKKFPIFQDMCKKKMSDGIRRRKLRDNAANIFCKYWPNFTPDHLVTKKILDEFDEKDLFQFCK